VIARDCDSDCRPEYSSPVPSQVLETGLCCLRRVGRQLPHRAGARDPLGRRARASR